MSPQPQGHDDTVTAAETAAPAAAAAATAAVTEPQTTEETLTQDQFADYMRKKCDSLNLETLAGSRSSRRIARDDISTRVPQMVNAADTNSLEAVLSTATAVLRSLYSDENEVLLRKPIGATLKPQTRTVRLLKISVCTKLSACLVANLLPNDNNNKTNFGPEDQRVQNAQRDCFQLSVMIMKILKEDADLRHALAEGSTRCDNRSENAPRISFFKKAHKEAESADKKAQKEARMSRGGGGS